MINLKEISKEDCLNSTIKGMNTAIESGKNTMDNLEIILEDFDNEILRMALQQYASLLQTVGEYLAQNSLFYERILISDPEESVYLEDNDQLMYITREDYEEMKAEEERIISYMINRK